MEIVDGQLHEPGSMLDWTQDEASLGRRILTELSLSLLDAVGVDAALLHPVAAEAWAEQMANDYPGRFASIITLDDIEAPDLDVRVEGLRSRPDVVGARIIASLPPSELDRLVAGAFEPVFSSCERHDLPVFLFISGGVRHVRAVAESHPNLSIVIDHIGLRQPPVEPYLARLNGWDFAAPDTPPFRQLPDLLALARYENVAVKLCGAPIFSKEPFPFSDVWPYVEEILAKFGTDRVFWASDIGRVRGRIGLNHHRLIDDYPGKHTYAESLAFISESDHLTSAEKAQLLGGTVRRLVRWSLPNEGS